MKIIISLRGQLADHPKLSTGESRDGELRGSEELRLKGNGVLNDCTYKDGPSNCGGSNWQ